MTIYNDHLLPSRLSGRVRENRMLTGYVLEMLKTKDAGLKIAFAERYAQLQEEREKLDAETREVLHTDKSAVAGAGGRR